MRFFLSPYLVLMVFLASPALAQTQVNDAENGVPEKSERLIVAPSKNSETDLDQQEKPRSAPKQTDNQLHDANSQLDDDSAWLAYGAYQRGHYLTAMELALPRAQLGDAAAQTLIAELLVEGLGVSRNMDDAVFWYQQGAKNGDASAQYKLALLLLDGKYVERNDEDARQWMLKAAENGNPFAQFNVGQMLVSEKPGDRGIQEALPYFEKAANHGIADAQYALSQIYSNSVGISEEKRQSARDLLQKAAIAGYDTARFDLAIWFINGTGGAVDYEAGFRWMLLAALKGNVAAQNRLSHLYIQAIGTKGNPIEAAKWHIISKRAGLNDRDLEDFFKGLTNEQQKAALDAANKAGF